MRRVVRIHWFASAVGIVLLASLSGSIHAQDMPDPAHIALGERLFLETRFAQTYAAASDHADKHVNCRTCHLVDEQRDTPGHGMRSYADFASHSTVPKRGDRQQVTARNSQVLVNASLPRKGAQLFHYDGEFTVMEDLVVATLTGRNHGWLAGERQAAIAHIAQVIRTDDGDGELAREFGGPYPVVLKGDSETISPEFRLAREYRIDVTQATDAQIVNAVARLIAAYVEDLTFSQDDTGAFDGSPYDRFLARNGLPRQPRGGETPMDYSRRLLKSIDALVSPHFVTGDEQQFELHDQRFVFGPLELAGLKLFLREAAGSPAHSAGNCMACHPAPNFTDFRFHNTGVTQHDYDAVHGAGAFSNLAIPALEERNTDYDKYLPPTEQHPHAAGRFRAIASKERPGDTDLGLWNVFANPDLSKPQSAITVMLCGSTESKNDRRADCGAATLLPRTIGRFKTPGLRNLGHANPYMHSGSFDDLASVLAFYVSVSAQARAREVRNISESVHGIQLGTEDVEPLVAFLRSLNEDYD